MPLPSNPAIPSDKTCEKPGCQSDSLEGRKICADHWAEYMRGYRARAVPKRERAAHFRGFEEAVQNCIRFLRETVGERALTGYQSAKLLEKAMTSAESPEALQRRKLVEAIGGGRL